MKRCCISTSKLLQYINKTYSRTYLLCCICDIVQFICTRQMYIKYNSIFLLSLLEISTVMLDTMCYQYNIISSIIFILIHSNTNSLQLIVYISHDPSSSTYVNCYNSNIYYCTIRSFDMVAVKCLKPLKHVSLWSI